MNKKTITFLIIFLIIFIPFLWYFVFYRDSSTSNAGRSNDNVNVYDYYSGEQREQVDEEDMIYLWDEDNIPTETVYTVNDSGYFDDPDFMPYLTYYGVPDGISIKGAVLVNPGGAFIFRSENTEGVEVASKLASLGYQSFVVHYRLEPYTMQEGALDLARGIRYVRSHAEDYNIDPEDIATVGFSAGGILAGEEILHFDGDVTGRVIDSSYEPDRLDQVSADVAAVGMIYSFYGQLSIASLDVDMFREANLPPSFYAYGTEDPFYSQMNASVSTLKEAGVEVESHVLDNMPHGFGIGNDDSQWIRPFDRFLTRIFED